MDTYIKQFKEINIGDISLVGGKNSSLGEMFSKLSAKVFQYPMVLLPLLLHSRNFLQIIH